MSTARKYFDFKVIAIVVLAALCTAVSMELFLLPSNVILGGALGIASIVTCY